MVDIFNPEVSKVVKGIQGKLVLIYGTNRTGKTKNAVKASKPLVVGFESGLGAIGGVANVRIKNWKMFIDVTKQLTDDKTVDKAREAYDTIVVDTVEGMADQAAAYVCSIYNVARIGDGKQNCHVCW